MPSKPVIGVGKISGMVIDSLTNLPVEFATVVLREALEHKEVDGAFTDEKGNFKFKELKNAKYEIAISFIGYESKIIGVFKINKDQTEHELGKILISPVSKVLEEVTITGQKELVENKIDRIVYNAERDVTTQGGNAADVLRRTPLLTVDMEGNVSLQGSSNVTVFINGKPSSIMAASVKDALKMIPADVIQKVEVITQPGAKYDAEGTAGIINIVTKSKKIQGVSGGFNASAGTRSNFLGSNVSIRMGKLGITGNLGGHLWRGNGRTDNTRENLIFPDTLFLTQTGRSSNLGGGMFAQGALDYDLTEKDNFTFSVRTPIGLFANQMDLTTSSGINTNVLPFSFRRESDNLNRNLGADFSLDYKHSFDKDSDKEFSTSAQYSINNRISRYLADQYDINNILNYREEGPNQSVNKEIIVAVDYLHPLKKDFNFETGAKTILRNVTSDIFYDTFNLESQVFQRDLRRDNFFEYIQNVGAAYTQITFPIVKNLSGRVGVRYEHTFIEGLVQEGSDFKNNYGTWIPNGLLSYKINSATSVKGSYTRRIQRPGMFYLNPYVNFNDPTNISYGNPELLPELTESFELSGGYSKNYNSLNVNIYHKTTNNLIDNYRFVDSLGVTNATYNNLATGYSTGVSVNGGIMKLGKIILNSTMNLFYQKIESERFVGVRNDAINFNINGFANVNITPTWSITLFGFYQAPRLTTQGKQATWFVYNLGARKEMWKKKGAISFGVDNPFHKWMKMNASFVSPEFSFISENRIEGWGIRASVEYRFGKMEFGAPAKKKRKGSLNDDLKQGDGDGAGGGMSGGR
ncbi:MAG: TonB-dependent receptor [Saprospiraceae bacterium]|nr:TonB-dependent receptor [Saprospiraceae bacterium]